MMCKDNNSHLTNGFVDDFAPTEQKTLCQEQGMHILRGFSMGKVYQISVKGSNLKTISFVTKPRDTIIKEL